MNEIAAGLAGNPPQVIRIPLLDAALNQQSFERVHGARITLQPSQRTGLHDHPCPVIGYIAAGRIRFQVDGQPERVLQAGDAFHEPARTRIRHFDNASNSETATFIAFYLLPANEHELIHMLPETAAE